MRPLQPIPLLQVHLVLILCLWIDPRRARAARACSPSTFESCSSQDHKLWISPKASGPPPLPPPLASTCARRTWTRTSAVLVRPSVSMPRPSNGESAGIEPITLMLQSLFSPSWSICTIHRPRAVSAVGSHAPSTDARLPKPVRLQHQLPPDDVESLAFAWFLAPALGGGARVRIRCAVFAPAAWRPASAGGKKQGKTRFSTSKAQFFSGQQAQIRGVQGGFHPIG